MISLQNVLDHSTAGDLGEQVGDVSEFDQLRVEQRHDQRQSGFARHDDSSSDLTVDVVIPLTVESEHQTKIAARLFDPSEPVDVLVFDRVGLGKSGVASVHCRPNVTRVPSFVFSHKLFHPSVNSPRFSAHVPEYGYRAPLTFTARLSFELFDLARPLFDVRAPIFIFALAILFSGDFARFVFFPLFLRI